MDSLYEAMLNAEELYEAIINALGHLDDWTYKQMCSNLEEEFENSRVGISIKRIQFETFTKNMYFLIDHRNNNKEYRISAGFWKRIKLDIHLNKVRDMHLNNVENKRRKELRKLSEDITHRIKYYSS